MATEEPQLRNPHIAECDANFDKVEKLYHELVDDLSDEQLLWKPSEQRWSVAQNIGHLLEANREYYKRLKPMIDAAVDAGKADPPYVGPHKAGFFGGMILKVVDPNGTMKAKTFKIFKPKEMPNDDQRREFIKYHKLLKELCAKADGLHTRKNKIGSPVSNLMPINLGDAFRITTLHAERHFNQARRLFDEADFPKS